MNDVTNGQGEVGAGTTADDWAAALAEDTRMNAPVKPAADEIFPPVTDQPAAPAAVVDPGMERINNIPVQLTAELGQTRITIKHLLGLTQGSVVELDGLAGQSLEVKVNGYPIAQGQVVQVGDKYGIRLTDIILPSERIQKLARS